MFISLALISIAAAVISFLHNRYDKTLAWFLGIVLTVAAGNETECFDREIYIDLIKQINALGTSDLEASLSIAKDPFFLLIVVAANEISQNPETAIYITIGLSVLFKLIAIRDFRCGRSAFMSFYCIFVAPGFEFAAIRAGLAVGILLFALQLGKVPRLFSFILAVSSHISVVAIATLNLFITFNKSITTILVFSIVIFGSSLVSTLQEMKFQHYSENTRFLAYFSDAGTMGALFYPSVTLFCWVFELNGRNQNLRRWTTLDQISANTITATLIASTLIAFTTVTTSFRLTEMSWGLMAFYMLKDRFKPREFKTKLLTSPILFAAILTSSNLARQTWLILL